MQGSSHSHFSNYCKLCKLCQGFWRGVCHRILNAYKLKPSARHPDTANKKKNCCHIIELCVHTLQRWQHWQTVTMLFVQNRIVSIIVTHVMYTIQHLDEKTHTPNQPHFHLLLLCNVKDTRPPKYSTPQSTVFASFNRKHT